MSEHSLEALKVSHGAGARGGVITGEEEVGGEGKVQGKEMGVGTPWCPGRLWGEAGGGGNCSQNLSYKHWGDLSGEGPRRLPVCCVAGQMQGWI